MSQTPMMAEGNSTFRTFIRFLRKPKDNKPSVALPSVKTDLETVAGPEPVIIWFGHSSYLILIEGKRILVDPVLSGHASPVPFMVRSFPGSDPYGTADIPEIDCLLLTHDHYDHLDYRTIYELQPRIGCIVCSLGVSSHLIHWGFDPELIHELDWHESLPVSDSLTFTAAPARHFSGRGFKRGMTLWSSFLLKSPTRNLYLGGDSGYDTHFLEIGQQYGPFDLAILESGQYNESWPFIHMMPEQTLEAARDLQTRVLLPVHWGKFSLALHPWNEPINRIMQAAPGYDFLVTTPRIGEPVVVGGPYPRDPWWNI